MTPYGTLLVRMVLMLMVLLMLMLMSMMSYTSSHDAPHTKEARPAMFILRVGLWDAQCLGVPPNRWLWVLQTVGC